MRGRAEDDGLTISTSRYFEESGATGETTGALDILRADVEYRGFPPAPVGASARNAWRSPAHYLRQQLRHSSFREVKDNHRELDGLVRVAWQVEVEGEPTVSTLPPGLDEAVVIGRLALNCPEDSR